MRASAASWRGAGQRALAWLLHSPVVTSPIIGPRTVQQMEGAVRALDIELSQRSWPVWIRLPGPGNQARSVCL